MRNTAKAKHFVSAFLLVLLDNKNNYGAVYLASLKHSPDSNNLTLRVATVSREYLIVDHDTWQKSSFIVPEMQALSTSARLHFPISLANPSHFSLSWKIPRRFPQSEFLHLLLETPAKSTSVPRPRFHCWRQPAPGFGHPLRPVLLFILPPFCPLPFFRLSSILLIVTLVSHAYESKLPKEYSPLYDVLYRHHALNSNLSLRYNWKKKKAWNFGLRFQFER